MYYLVKKKMKEIEEREICLLFSLCFGLIDSRKREM
jgi:hypothetical protein